jgi:hypothetical protein
VIRKKKHLVIDGVLLAVSIFFAVYISETGIAHEFILSFGALKWLGILLAGMFFTSVFTTAPAIIILSQFAEITPVWLLAVIAGLGAMLGDYILFRLVRDRMSEDFSYLLSFSKFKRFRSIFKTKLFHFFAMFVGALIIASPFPDELGIAMLGISKVEAKRFLLISFLFNTAGVFLIGLIARAVA